jgi:alpha-L-rhamnosidase
MGDALDASEQAMFNFDTEAVHEAFIQGILDNQGVNGDVPIDVPRSIPKASCNDIAWTSAYPQITNMLYNYYGDLRIIERHWDSLVMYQEMLLANASHVGLSECDTFKDWLCGDVSQHNQRWSCCSNTPAGSTCNVGPEMGGYNFVLGLRAMANMASILGQSSAASRYAVAAERGRQVFHRTFYNPGFRAYGGDEGAFQSLNLPAIEIEAPPHPLLASVVQGLANDFAQRTNMTPQVGSVTSKIILNVLSENGLHSTALRVATTTQKPSWGWWWSQNATTCWEAFGGGGLTRNHIFLCGGYGHWLWKHLVGLQQTSPGFATVLIAPKIDEDYGPKSVGGEFLSPKGLIKSRWVLNATKFTLDVALPIGVTSAEITVPAIGGHTGVKRSITCNGKVVWSDDNFTASAGLESATLASDGAGVVFTVSNGAFNFAQAAGTTRSNIIF